MRTRNKGYTDYGFAPGEEKELKEYCRCLDFSDDLLLFECAKKSNPVIGSDLYFSLVKGLSWEQLDKRTMQLYGKGDFYGYRRKALALFRKALLKCGRYPVAMK